MFLVSCVFFSFTETCKPSNITKLSVLILKLLVFLVSCVVFFSFIETRKPSNITKLSVLILGCLCFLCFLVSLRPVRRGSKSARRGPNPLADMDYVNIVICYE